MGCAVGEGNVGLLVGVFDGLLVGLGAATVGLLEGLRVGLGVGALLGRTVIGANV